MNSIIKILILWILSVHHTIAESLSRGVIIGPETRLYYLKYPKPDYLKVDEIKDVFEASPAYDYYRDPKNREGTLFISIMIIVDHIIVRADRTVRNHWKEEGIVADIVKKWNEVDNYFEQLKDIKVKILITGVVIPEKPDLWGPVKRDFFTNYATNEVTEEYYYSIPTTLENIQKFLSDNIAAFGYYHFDYFIYMSQYRFYDDTDISKNGHTQYSYSITDNICAEDLIYGALVYRNDFYSLSVTSIIAAGLLVDEDIRAGCGKGYIMDFDQNHDVTRTWSSCSQNFFKNMYNNSDYECLQNITYYEELKKLMNDDDL